jgi:hypothetical protein
VLFVRPLKERVLAGKELPVMEAHMDFTRHTKLLFE